MGLKMLFHAPVYFVHRFGLGFAVLVFVFLALNVRSFCIDDLVDRLMQVGGFYVAIDNDVGFVRF